MLMQALNEESQIRDCVRSLRELDPPAHEILVVDGGSDDRCADLAYCLVLLLWQAGGCGVPELSKISALGPSMHEANLVLGGSSDTCAEFSAQSQ